MISSGVRSGRPWRCSPLPAVEVPGLNGWLVWCERLAVSNAIVDWPSVVAERVADVVRGIVIGGPEILLRGVGEKTLPARIDGFELREVLDKQPELSAIAVHQGAGAPAPYDRVP
jgi:hypothetical protein